MTKIILAFLSCLLSVSISSSFQHSLTLYTGFNYTEDSLYFTNKRPNLFALSPEIIAAHKSYCVRGYWSFFERNNYTGPQNNFDALESEVCENGHLMQRHFGSGRFPGPSDTSRESISFYSGENFSGEEIVVEEFAFSEMSFAPASLFITGFSNWTFYEGTSFNGIATCFISTQEIHVIPVWDRQQSKINSMLKRCIASVDNRIKLH